MITKRFRLAAAVLLLSAMGLSASRADDPVVFNQPYNTDEDTSWDSYTAPGDTPATVYDNFALQASTDVTAVQWQGTYIDHNNLNANPAAPNVTAFQISFYADNNGTPGTQISTVTVPIAGCAQSSLGTVGFNAFNDSVTHQISYYSYRATLPTPFGAAAGRTYWLSIVGVNATAAPIWSWYASTDDGDTTCIQDFAGNRITRPSDRAVALEGVAAALDITPAATVVVTAKKASANTGSPGVFTVSLPSPATGKLKVKYTLGGTAINGTDYARLSGKAKFKAGESSVDVLVTPPTPPVGVYYGAFNKKVTLTLQPGPGYTVATPAPAKVKIVRTAGIILP